MRPRTAKTEREKSLGMVWKQAFGCPSGESLGKARKQIILDGGLA